MADDTFYTLEDVKDLLGETGDGNNDKITQYGRMADNKIKTNLANVRDSLSGDPVLPFTAVPNEIKDLANLLAMGYFYKFESASTDILEQGLIDLEEYITTKYRRIRFTSESSPT